MKLTRPAPQDSVHGWGDPVGHKGMDFGWGSGDTVTAAADGEVISVYGGGGYNSGWGNLVLIRHTESATTGYAHLATGTIAVSKGQHVKAGQRIGTMGATGKVTAKHLHFELRLNGTGGDARVDPRPYFSQDLPGSSGDVFAAQRTVRPNVGTEGFLNGRLAPTTSAEVRQRLASNVVGTFDGFIVGQTVTVDGVTSNIWYRGAFNGNYFAAAGFTTQDTSGLKDLGSAVAPKVKKVRLNGGQGFYYFYYQLANAQKGNYASNQRLQNGDYPLVREDPSGPRLIQTQDYGQVWVGTRNTRPEIVEV